MTLFIYDKFITKTSSGETVPAAVVTIYKEGGSLASLYLDSAGTTTAGNPVTASPSGRVQVYMEAGTYTVSAMSGGSIINYPDVVIGSLTDIDIDGSDISIQDWAQSTEDQLNEIRPDQNLVDVFYIYGQSNAKGSAGGSSGRLPISDGLRYWSLDSQSLEPLVYEMESTSTYGVEEAHLSSGHAWVSFGNRYKQLTGRDCVFIPGAIGGTTIANLEKNSSTDIYDDMVTEGLKAVAAIQSEGNAIGSISCVFMQGESDQSGGTSYQVYYNTLETVFDDMMSDLNVEKFFVSLVGCAPSRNELDWSEVRNAQLALVDNYNEATVAFSDFKNFDTTNNLLLIDGTHASQRGYNIMGKVMAEHAVYTEYPDYLKDVDYVKEYSIPEYNNIGRVKVISGFIRTDDSGTSVLTKDNNSIYTSANVTGVSTSSTTATVGCLGIKGFKVLSFTCSSVVETDRRIIVNASIEPTTVSTDKLGLAIRMSTDFNFVIDTDAGIIYQNEQLDDILLQDTDSLSISDGVTYWTITHNAGIFTPTISRILASGTSDEVDTIRPVIVSSSEFRVPKLSGLLSCFIPSMSVRPTGVKAGSSVVTSFRCEVLTNDG